MTAGRYVIRCWASWLLHRPDCEKVPEDPDDFAVRRGSRGRHTGQGLALGAMQLVRAGRADEALLGHGLHGQVDEKGSQREDEHGAEHRGEATHYLMAPPPTLPLRLNV